MTLEQAETKIRNAWIASLISGFITLFFTVMAATRGGGIVNVGGAIVSLWNLLDVFLIFLFAFGIYMKSRVAAIGMFIYFLASKLMMWAGVPQIGASVLIGILIGIIFLYFYFEGARSAVTYRRLRQSSATTIPPRGAR
jgi:hypothetical protein